MDLKDTIQLMQSENFKDRFKAEYYQTKIRLDKLNQMITKYKACTLDFTPRTPIKILEEQACHMGNYLKQLEIRAEIEGVDLSEV